MSRFSKNQKITLAAVGSLMIIIILGIVYAAFTQQLNINGSATGRSSTWRVYFSSLSNASLTGTAKELTAPEIDSNNQTSIGNYSVSVTSPGDSVEYTFDVTNSGDYDATLTGLNKTNPTCTGDGANASTDASNVCGKLTYTLKYADGTTVTQNDTLKSKETKTMKLKLTYNTFDDASLLPKADVAITGLGITLTYTQDGNAKVNSDGSTPLITYTAYSVGDQITVAGEQYYVIANSGSSQDYVVALKATPLTSSEINNSGGYSLSNYSEPIGTIQYSPSSDYSSSNIELIVEEWSINKFSNNELKIVGGYAARLITLDEVKMFGYADEPVSPCDNVCGEFHYLKTNDVPSWIWVESYLYFTMSPYEDSSLHVWSVRWDGVIINAYINTTNGAVRPVINVYKSAITQS